MKREDLEMILKDYLYKLNKFCPYFIEYLELNNNIALYLLDIYDQGILPESREYQQVINKNDSILLAHEIISSISPNLGTKFIELINNQQIYFISKEEQEFSCTYGLDGISYSSVNDHNNICTTICLIHEFFHNIHLTKYNCDMTNADWFFHTEVFGLMGDLYSIFYLLNYKKELSSEVKNYLCEFFESIIACSDKCLITGTTIDIYTKKNSLSSNSIKEYIRENNLSKGYENILNLMSAEDDVYEYYKEVPYIFAFPVAFQLSANLLIEQEYKQLFVDMFEKVADIQPKEWFQKMKVFEHIEDSGVLHEVMNAYYTNMIDMYKNNPKIKKIGEL